MPHPTAQPTTRRRHRSTVRHGIPTVVLAASLLSAGGALAQGGGAAPAAAVARTPAQQAAVDLGRRTYLGLCLRCHGANLVPAGGGGIDLRRFPADGRERFNKAVTQGLRAMPAFGTTVSPAQLDGLWAYVASVNGWPAP